MAKGFNITITHNIPKVANKLNAMPVKISRGLKSAVRKAGSLVERASKVRAPVDTGRMRASIHTINQPLSVTIQPEVNYAIFVHDGTRFMSGRPFLTKGFADVRDTITRTFEKEIRKALK